MLIAQISDLHIRMPGQKAYRVVETDRYLPPAIQALNAQNPLPDCAIISGDLTDFGRPAEYAHLRAMLQTLKMPYYLMPGNHDDRAALRQAFPEHAYLQGKGDYLQYAIDTHPLRILALDTLVPRQSHGTLCAQRLQWLAGQLAAQPGRPTVIAMHHPPFRTGIGHMDDIGLLQGAPELEAIVARHPNVERILCGHVHRTIFRRFAGTIASCCPSTAHQIVLDLRPDAPSAFVMEPPGYQLHSWQDGALVTHHGVIGQYAGPHPFHEDGALIDE
ncbi:phosphodiesterase [Orrella sp. JC864]|uniref:phosphodiesterase n=1 Tax=Orrella sp. JC864 TaxID=3120298 RepID=UPI0012BB95C3